MSLASIFLPKQVADKQNVVSIRIILVSVLIFEKFMSLSVMHTNTLERIIYSCFIILFLLQSHRTDVIGLRLAVSIAHVRKKLPQDADGFCLWEILSGFSNGLVIIAIGFSEINDTLPAFRSLDSHHATAVHLFVGPVGIANIE